MHKKRKILLIEDDENDIFFIKRSLEKYHLEKDLIVINNGGDAIDFITKGKEIHGEKFSPLIKLVLLDLKMPGMDGIGVLKAIKKNLPTEHLEIVVLTTSDDDPDIAKCKQLGANSYIVKPISHEEFDKVVGDLGHYWMDIDKF